MVTISLTSFYIFCNLVSVSLALCDKFKRTLYFEGEALFESRTQWRYFVMMMMIYLVTISLFSQAALILVPHSKRTPKGWLT